MGICYSEEQYQDDRLNPNSPNNFVVVFLGDIRDQLQPVNQKSQSIIKTLEPVHTRLNNTATQQHKQQFAKASRSAYARYMQYRNMVKDRKPDGRMQEAHQGLQSSCIYMNYMMLKVMLEMAFISDQWEQLTESQQKYLILYVQPYVKLLEKLGEHSKYFINAYQELGNLFNKDFWNASNLQFASMFITFKRFE